jgi:3-deoxy-manno-octulosonate cytidylyltransferase (CMP-KDO synthetase)
MKIAGIIPARYASSRFPGKPLVKINGKAMIVRVLEQAQQCRLLETVVVATDDDRIYNHVLAAGGRAVMTSENHRTGTERCGEVMEWFEKQGLHYDVAINIQGDEPYIEPGLISQLAGCFSDPAVQLASLVKKIRRPQDLSDPGIMKVVFDKNMDALYFSRAAIPFVRDAEFSAWTGKHCFYGHIGIYGYRRETLQSVIALPQGDLETAESLEQLRWLENGWKIRLAVTEHESYSVDTPEDLEKFAGMA